MGWLDSLRRRGEEAQQVTPVTVVTHVQPDRGEWVAPKPIAKPRPKLQEVLIQTSAPRDGYPGSVEIGWYTLEDGVVRMRNETGEPTGATHTLKPGEDPARMAQVMKRAAWSKAMGEGSFNRPIYYPLLPVV